MRERERREGGERTCKAALPRSGESFSNERFSD